IVDVRGPEALRAISVFSIICIIPPVNLYHFQIQLHYITNVCHNQAFDAYFTYISAKLRQN
ncbi:MAG: hypothetical protein IJF67_13630, partial [Clostridia bacterium]|nr:hypothetical protein [Clostridia bacterium]